MDHADHEPGTMQECPECRVLAVEPGWYKALRDERSAAGGRARVIVPDADVEVPVRPDVEVPELEAAEGER
jgi:hypothetical protein